MNLEPSLRNEAASPLDDIGYFLKPGFDGCEATAKAIDFLLGKFPVRDRWCVEFGAGADSHGSTTHRLIAEQEYSAVLIEGVKEKYQYLCNLYKDNHKVLLLEKFVSFRPGEDDCLDRILAKTPVPTDLDFLSIDIDGNDYHVWKAISQYQPKLLMIEFNPTIPPEVEYVQTADPRINFGNSLAALVELGKAKGYELVCVIGVNALFVRQQNYPLFGIKDNSLRALWTRRDCVTYIFSGYDGRIVLHGCRRLPWLFDIPIQESSVQVLPRFFQKYPFTSNDYRWFQLLNSPLALAKKSLRKIFRT